jgi:hypothetical protein
MWASADLLLAVSFSMTNLEIAMANESVESPYAECQLWTFRTHPRENAATLLINRIDHGPTSGEIFHISVFGVRLDNPMAPAGVTTELPHFPVSRETLDKSCLELQGTRAPNPDYLQGYGEWRETFDAGKAGVFDIPVAEIVYIVQQAIAQHAAR